MATGKDIYATTAVLIYVMLGVRIVHNECGSTSEVCATYLLSEICIFISYKGSNC